MRTVFAMGLALLTLTPMVLQAAEPLDSVPLIAREKLFGNPSQTGGQLSPDGRWISWIAPREGVLNVWVAPATDPSRAKALTAEKRQPIFTTFWAPDSKTVLYINDRGGDENFLLYGVDVESGTARAYTPFEKTRVTIVGISSRVKDRILIGINNRDPRWPDIYALDIASAKLSLVQRNDGYGNYFADRDLVLRLAQKPTADGGVEYFRVNGGAVDDKPLAAVGLEDSRSTAPLGFTVDGKTLYWKDSRGRDKAALVAQDMASGRLEVVAEDHRADIVDALFDSSTGRAQAYSVNYLTSEYVALDPGIKVDLEKLRLAAGAQFTITSRTDADERWLVAVDRVTRPIAAFLYDRKDQRLSPLYVTRPELEAAPLVPMQALELKSRDGLTLVSYLSLPKSSGANAEGKPARPVPMVLFVHGGPWERDTYGYKTLHQWLANRGYAVLSVNFRGSTGFGKGFISAGNLEWGRKMQDDLLDAVAWAVKSGITSADKVAIVGGSYGGYATLAGLAFTPKAFACGVDGAGPSNLHTLLGTISSRFEARRREYHGRIGDPGTDAGRALLTERSPLNAADRIERPLLIGHGANDPRVNIAESDRIVAAMASRKIPVTYVVFPDEGHGLDRPVNRLAFWAVAENFLAQCLGGRAEPIGDTLKASTAEVRQGAEVVPGLRAEGQPTR